jgi:hypothetical protein
MLKQEGKSLQSIRGELQLLFRMINLIPEATFNQFAKQMEIKQEKLFKSVISRTTKKTKSSIENDHSNSLSNDEISLVDSPIVNKSTWVSNFSSDQESKSVDFIAATAECIQ